MAKRQGSVRLPFGQMIAHVKRLFLIGKPPQWALFVAPATIVVSAALVSLPPLFVGAIVDALQHRNIGQALRELLLYVSVMLVSGLVALVSSYTASVFREALARNLQLFLFAKLNRSRIDAISELTHGQIVNRILGDVRALVTQLELSAVPLLSSACAFVATVAVMLRLEWRLAIVALICSIIVLVPVRIARHHLASLQQQSSAAGDDLYGAIAESASIVGLTANRNASAVRRAVQTIADITNRVRRVEVKIAVVRSLAGIGSTIAGMIGPVAVLGFGAYLVVHGQLTVGMMVSVLIFQSRLSAPIGTFSGMQTTFAYMAVTMGRILQVADLPEERGGSNAFVLGDITISGVTLTLGKRTVLNSVNLDIARGAHIALVGPSGSGKSSLAALLWRLRDASSGEIEIGSVPIREFSLESLRDSVFIVSQDPFIFNTSLLENIVPSREAYDGDFLELVIDAVMLREFVNSLPHGLNTEIGQQGFRMSGGERQRVCLARALMRWPKVLILDEALTGVDMDMERHIMREVRRLLFDRTIIAITHRLESIRDFDSVIMIDKGAVAVTGSPELLYGDERLRRMMASWRV